jgi:1-phosphatidylinositol-4-phosphate 5-kinase
MKSNFGVIEVIKGVGVGKRTREEAASSIVVNPTKVLSFGHPQWVQICQILAGIEISASNPAAFRDAPDSSSAQQAKFSYNIPNGPTTSVEVSASPMSDSSPTGTSPFLRNPFARSDTVTFSDYCPSTFEGIRRRFGISKEEYLSSLGFTQTKRNLFFGCLSALYEMSSSGRSGSFFYSSTDNRFILKTIPAAESNTLRKILPSYYAHVVQYPNTLLTRFCGLHALVRNGVKMIFVVMQNIFQNAVPIQDTFDLKGSTINRSTPMEQRHLGVALKDNDFDGRRLMINSSIREQLIAQLEADSRLLTKFNLNDYSFLLGIHKSLDGPLPIDDPSESPSPKYSAFQKEYGGIHSVGGEEVYFVGIIDCLTDYGLKKMGEHISKSVLYDSKQVSCVPPQEYQRRFISYLSNVFVSS